MQNCIRVFFSYLNDRICNEDVFLGAYDFTTMKFMY